MCVITSLQQHHHQYHMSVSYYSCRTPLLATVKADLRSEPQGLSPKCIKEAHAKCHCSLLDLALPHSVFCCTFSLKTQSMSKCCTFSA